MKFIRKPFIVGPLGKLPYLLVREAGRNLREHSRFEKARVIGARALQISMGAPVDIKVPKDIIDPVLIAQMEYEQDVIPIDIVDREKK
jgi:DNA-directed RNA polymerase subunit K|tara:strand:- start:2526 stop:2789 length:264 start_codon:yes stop_codon:yes gene_type:complete